MQAYLVHRQSKASPRRAQRFRHVRAQSFATGGWGPNETLCAPGSGALGDSLTRTHSSFETPCGAYAMFKITRYLLRVTRDTRYGDSMERVLYNTILGAKPIPRAATASIIPITTIRAPSSIITTSGHAAPEPLPKSQPITASALISTMPKGESTSTLCAFTRLLGAAQEPSPSLKPRVIHSNPPPRSPSPSKAHRDSHLSAHP